MGATPKQGLVSRTAGGDTLCVLAVFYLNQERYEQAERCYQRTFAILLGPANSEHEYASAVLLHVSYYAELLRKMQKEEHAVRLRSMGSSLV
jgi:tetratricopeptide (TPR) repeat protein